jgi:hypothetical protein
MQLKFLSQLGRELRGLVAPMTSGHFESALVPPPEFNPPYLPRPRMLQMKPLLQALALTLVPLTAWAAESAHEHHGGAKSSNERTAQAELGAIAVFDSAGTLWAAHKVHGFIAVSRSDDAGRTWSKPVHVNAKVEVTDTGGDARPKIAIGPGGQIYVTWTKALSKPHTGEIRFSRSLDGGRTFQPPSTVHKDRDEITHRFDAIAVNGRGQVFVAWIDKRDLIAATAAKTPYRGAAVYYAVSDDFGASFRGDFKLADHGCECCRISLVTRDDDTVHAMWRHVFEPNIRDHAVTQLHADGRAGVVRRATFENWKVDACPHHGPSLAAQAGGPFHAVWFTLAPKKEGIYYGRLRDQGVDAQRRVGDDTAAHADLAVSGKRVVIAWKEFDGEHSKLRAMVSEDGGDRWKEHVLASTGGASDQPKVLARGEQFYVFWNTRNEPLSTTPVP